ncbi:MAG TPA: ABC transporter ATP-binding protein [Polyangiaceae bacterium]|nr:ABC transporter ATP-binding protein [Polyangiaceae bacterium]
MSAALSVQDLVAGYGSTLVLEGVSLELPRGGSLAVLGRNGAGKTTLLRTLMGFTTLRSGSIWLDGKSLTELPVHRRVHTGLGYVPQGRDIFPSLTVHENLAIAARPGGFSLGAMYELFPSLAERRRSTGNRLSGGEQQMLAIARALVGGPRVLLLDEPLEGLAPIIVETLLERLRALRERLSIILVEQKVDLALAFADTAVVLERGKVVFNGPSAQLAADEAAQGRWLGVSVQ